MANILPEDEELFKNIATEHIQINPVLWNVIYQYIGDPIIVINLLVRSFIDYNQPIPKNEKPGCFINSQKGKPKAYFSGYSNVRHVWP